MTKSKTTEPTPVHFTRSEFRLLASLLADEVNSPRAAINDRYRRDIDGLKNRITDVLVGFTDGALITDTVTVLA